VKQSALDNDDMEVVPPDGIDGRPEDTPDTSRALRASDTPRAIEEHAAGAEAVTLDHLQRAIAGMTNSGGSSSLAGVTPSLADLLHPAVIGDALHHPSMAPFLANLLKLLPEQDRDDASNLEQVLNCPPLRAQAAALTTALASGSTGDLLASFSIPQDSTTDSGGIGAAGVQSFLQALRNLSRRRRDQN
jgi:UCH-binding domain